MGHTESPSSDDTQARCLASSLERIADRLGNARCADDFMSALEENSQVWEQVGREASRHGWRIPRNAVGFSLNSSRRGRVSDQDVEALISINLQTSSSIRANDGMS
jgi:hypothetical protein